MVRKNLSPPGHTLLSRGCQRFYPRPLLSLELTLDPWVPRVGDGSEWQLPWSLKNPHFPVPLHAFLLGQPTQLDCLFPKDWLSQEVTWCSCQEAPVTNQPSPVHSRLGWWTHSSFPGTFPVLTQEVSGSGQSLSLEQTRAVDKAYLKPRSHCIQTQTRTGSHLCKTFSTHLDLCSLLPPTAPVATSGDSVSSVFSLQKLVGNDSNQDRRGSLRIQSLQKWSFGSYHLV